jgi:hypothetical protein
MDPFRLEMIGQVEDVFRLALRQPAAGQRLRAGLDDLRRRASVVKGSGWPRRCMSPNCGISLFMMRSRRMSSAFASAQYGGTEG